MINNVILVGTIINDVKLNVVGEYEVCTIVLRVQRPFRDMETNEYKCDFIPVTFWNVYAKSISSFCCKGDVVGVKARLVRKVNGVTKDNVSIYSTEVIGERVAFINLKHTNEQLRGLKDKSDDYDENNEYGEPTLEDLKKMAKSADVNGFDMNQERLDEEFRKDFEDEYQEEDNSKKEKGKTNKKK